VPATPRGGRVHEFSDSSDAPQRAKPWPVLRRIALLLSFWLFIGFAFGTVLLLFPVRWWVNLSRASGWAHSTESIGVAVIILALVLVSFALAYRAMLAFVRTDRPLVRAGLVLITMGAAGMAYGLWVTPSLMKGSMAAEQTAGAHFTFGPFPDAARLATLKAEGYTGVISLLHPAVVPFEPQLIAQERKEATAAGIKLIHLPMLPWVSENTDSLDKLRAIAVANQGRYYIHCYLGADRVNVARRIIEQASAAGVVIEGAGAATRRTLEGMLRVGFERGPIFRLEQGLYLIPYPTDGEFLSYILNGEVKNVVALLDSRNAEEKTRIDYERKLLESHSLPFHLVEVSDVRYGGRRILEAVAMAQKLERPTVIHSFFTPGPRTASVAEAVLIAQRTGLPPLAPSMWRGAMINGQPELIAPHIASGPAPTAMEFSEVLYARGVRTAIYVGDAGAGERPETVVAEQAGITLRTVAAAAVLELVASGGPYYLYGPGAGPAQTAILKRYAGLMAPAKPLAGTASPSP